MSSCLANELVLRNIALRISNLSTFRYFVAFPQFSTVYALFKSLLVSPYTFPHMSLKI